MGGQFHPGETVTSGEVRLRPPDAPGRCRGQYELLRQRVLGALADEFPGASHHLPSGGAAPAGPPVRIAVVALMHPTGAVLLHLRDPAAGPSPASGPGAGGWGHTASVAPEYLFEDDGRRWLRAVARAVASSLLGRRLDEVAVIWSVLMARAGGWRTAAGLAGRPASTVRELHARITVGEEITRRFTDCDRLVSEN